MITYNVWIHVEQNNNDESHVNLDEEFMPIKIGVAQTKEEIEMVFARLEQADFSHFFDSEQTNKLNEIYDRMRSLLSNDEGDYDIIIEKCKEKLRAKEDNFPVAFIDEVDLWDQINPGMTVADFCDTVGIEI